MVKILHINDRHFGLEVISWDLEIGSNVTPPLPDGKKVVTFFHE